MWRFLAGAVAALALAAAGLFWFGMRGSGDRVAAALPLAAQSAPADATDPLPDSVPAASARTREERRFGRYDKDRDGRITREEYLASRRKAFARLDLDHDGRLGFDEWAAKSTGRFAAADADHDGAMTPTEFATTAVKRRTPARPRCACPAPAAAKPVPAEDDEG